MKRSFFTRHYTSVLPCCQAQTKANNAKALAILEGADPMIVLGKGSYKVKAFYKAIEDPYGDNLIEDV